MSHEPSGRVLILERAYRRLALTSNSAHGRLQELPEIRKQRVAQWAVIDFRDRCTLSARSVAKTLTLVDDRFLLPEVGERGEGLDSVLLGQPFVVDFDEVHAKIVGVIVNFL
jgi:hypothetical protein